MMSQLIVLALILALAVPLLALVRKPACANAIAPDDFARRRNCWMALTAVAFLSPGFWVFILIAGVLLTYVFSLEKRPLGLYFFLLFALPPIGADIPAFGIVNALFKIDYLRLLSLVVLWPMMFRASNLTSTECKKSALPEMLLLAYIGLALVLQILLDSFTNTLRVAFGYFLDFYLPYYVASRVLRDQSDFRDALMSFVVAAMVMVPLSVFEYGKGQLLYFTLKESFGQYWTFGNYSLRGGDLRALVTTGQPIVLGYVMMVALGLFLFFKKTISNRLHYAAGILLFLVGLITPVSRGPWVGAAAMYVTYLSLSAQGMKRLAKIAAVGVIIVTVLMVSPFDLPYVGKGEDENILYRHSLIEVSTGMILKNPIFGSFDYMEAPEMQVLLQGEGIIDIVNTYIGVALTYGLVGLSLFVGFFAAILIPLFRRLRRIKDKESENYLLGQSLLAAFVGILVTIFTVSSIAVIPYVYWSLAGVCVAWIRMIDRESTSTKLQEANGGRTI